MKILTMPDPHARYGMRNVFSYRVRSFPTISPEVLS